jgi:hypothetical protein
VPVEHYGHRQLVRQRDFQFVATPEADIALWRQAEKRPNRCISFSRTQGDDAAFGLEHQRLAALSGCDPRQGRTKDGSAQSGQKLASV